MSNWEGHQCIGLYLWFKCRKIPHSHRFDGENNCMGTLSQEKVHMFWLDSIYLYRKKCANHYLNEMIEENKFKKKLPEKRWPTLLLSL